MVTFIIGSALVIPFLMLIDWIGYTISDTKNNLGGVARSGKLVAKAGEILIIEKDNSITKIKRDKQYGGIIITRDDFETSGMHII